jgi:hypothetical protein
MMMKRMTVPVLLVAALGFAGPAAAQSIGFKIGPTWSKVDIDEADEEAIETLTSFGGGGFIRFGVGGLGLEVDVLAITKGAEVAEPTEGDVNFKIDYVEVPVQLVFSLGSGRFSPYIMAGPSFGFEIGCEVDDESTAGDDEIDCDDADFFDRKSLDIGLAGAAGLQIPLGPGSVLVEGRYTHGLTNIADVEGDGGDEIKNRSYAIFGGYTIPIGRR